MARLGTTTFRRRNYDGLIRLRDEARKLNLDRPTIIDIGPGGVVDFLLNHLPPGKKVEWTKFQKVQRAIVRPFEELLRKTGLFDLETSEPEEIACLFEEFCPHEIYVVDIEPKVGDAVERMVKRNGFPFNVGFDALDLTKGHLHCQGDLVIAYNVVQRTSDYSASLRTIAAAVAPRGLLSINVEGEIEGFSKVDRSLYSRN